MYSYPHGIGEYVLEACNVPGVLRSADGPRDADVEAITTQPLRAIEWHLLFAGVQRVLSLPILGLEPGARFWVALSDNIR